MPLPVHVVIPDTQVKPDVPTQHLTWIGRYIVDHFAGRPNVRLIHLGDHWDMPSLSSYDRGTRKAEGRRVRADIAAGNAGFDQLCEPLDLYNATRRARKERQWWPDRHLLLGNHEERIERAANTTPELEGFLSYDLLNAADHGWTVHEYLKPTYLDGVGYAHYWQNRMTGKPLGGSALNRLQKLGHSFTMGHQQTLDVATWYTGDGRQLRGLIAGACYLHDEEYKGHQGNAHWRGIVVCHEVRDGAYGLMEVSLDYLCRRYAGRPLEELRRELGLGELSDVA